ncbi:MAG: membrane dipeptidase [Chloroflexota bacterium]|nr:membrane dipeptidase [Chloroflexota bacterium]
MHIVDAHEDIAWNALVLGRDVRRSALETRRLEQDTCIPQYNGLCMVGLPEWLAGGITVVCGTIFVSPARRGSPEPHTYTTAEEAHALAQAQLDFYHHLASECDQIALIETRADLDGVLASWESKTPKVGIVLLMEGADPIREPAEAEQWFECGVRLVSLSWKTGSQYAGGDTVPGPLTDAGRELLAAMADLGLVLDVSHLAQEALCEALDRFEGQIVATHANPRARVPGPRQLSDEMIHRLARRDGTIGIVPFNRFLHRGWAKGDPKDAVTVADVAAAVDHVCQVVGDAAHVGLGSDFDGGFGAESAPAEIDTIADLARIGPALGELGYSQEDTSAILSDNWLRVLRAALPE